MVSVVERIMHRLSIPLRDTWKGIDGYNLDDFFANGRYGGQRLFTINRGTGEQAQVAGGKIYTCPGFRSAAWDSYRIDIPDRLSSRADAAVHEVVHFLQHTTTQEDGMYVKFDGTNYLEYIHQRVELEAHMVQLFFLSRTYNPKAHFSASAQLELRKKLVPQIHVDNPPRTASMILRAKDLRII